MTSSTSEHGPAELAPEPKPDKLRDIFTQELDGVLEDATAHGVLVARVVADHVVEQTFEEAEAELGKLTDKQQELCTSNSALAEQQRALLLGNVLLIQSLAGTSTELIGAQDQLKTTEAATRQRLLQLVVTSVMLRHLVADAEERVIGFTGALHGKQYLLGRADAGIFARELTADELDKKIAQRRATLAQIEAEIQAAETKKLAAEGFRWPTGEEDKGNGILAKEPPLSDDDDPHAAVPDGARIVMPEGVIDSRFADSDATRVLPKLPATAIIPVEQQ